MIWSRVGFGIAKPNACAENSCRATYRKAWIHSSGLIAAAKAAVRIQGTTYQTAAVPKTAKLRAIATSAAAVRSISRRRASRARAGDGGTTRGGSWGGRRG